MNSMLQWPMMWALLVLRILQMVKHWRICLPKSTFQVINWKVLGVKTWKDVNHSQARCLNYAFLCYPEWPKWSILSERQVSPQIHLTLELVGSGTPKTKGVAWEDGWMDGRVDGWMWKDGCERMDVKRWEQGLLWLMIWMAAFEDV